MSAPSSTIMALDLLRFGVVDDNAYFRRLTRATLGAFGVRQVLEAPTIDDGWNLVAGGRSDVLLLDWQFPDDPAGGMKLLDRIRTSTNDAIATQAVIVLSAHSEKRHVLAAIGRGANDFIIKPVSPATLYARIVRVVRNSNRYIRRGGRTMPLPAGARPPPMTPPPVAKPEVEEDVMYI